MTINEKSTLWNILVKYDNTLTSFANSLSNVIQSKDSNDDLVNIFSFYNKIDKDDTKSVDSILGNRILFSLNP